MKFSKTSLSVFAAVTILMVPFLGGTTSATQMPAVTTIPNPPATTIFISLSTDSVDVSCGDQFLGVTVRMTSNQPLSGPIKMANLFGLSSSNGFLTLSTISSSDFEKTSQGWATIGRYTPSGTMFITTIGGGPDPTGATKVQIVNNPTCDVVNPALSVKRGKAITGTQILSAAGFSLIDDFKLSLKSGNNATKSTCKVPSSGNVANKIKVVAIKRGTCSLKVTYKFSKNYNQSLTREIQVKVT
jgi:hypothetical protein